MTVDFAERVLAGVPLLIAERADGASPHATVLWYHGLNARKEDHRAELARLAEAGFRAVGVDAVGHGARGRADPAAIVAAPREETRRAMREMVDATAHELPVLVRALVHLMDAVVATAGRDDALARQASRLDGNRGPFRGSSCLNPT